MILGAGQWINGADWGKYALILGMVVWLGVLFQWFSEAVSESESGQYAQNRPFFPLEYELVYFL